jgi:hypothetical protein
MKSPLESVLKVLLGIAIACAMCHTANAGELQVLAVSGTVIDSSNRSLPGCLVSVVSSFGRSAPGFTQSDGKFNIDVSLPPDTFHMASGEVYLEIYWDRILKFRQPLVSLPMASAEPYSRNSAAASSWPSLLHDGGRVVLQPITLGK